MAGIFQRLIERFVPWFPAPSTPKPPQSGTTGSVAAENPAAVCEASDFSAEPTPEAPRPSDRIQRGDGARAAQLTVDAPLQTVLELTRSSDPDLSREAADLLLYRYRTRPAERDAIEGWAAYATRQINHDSSSLADYNELRAAIRVGREIYPEAGLRHPEDGGAAEIVGGLESVRENYYLETVRTEAAAALESIACEIQIAVSEGALPVSESPALDDSQPNSLTASNSYAGLAGLDDGLRPLVLETPAPGANTARSNDPIYLVMLPASAGGAGREIVLDRPLVGALIVSLGDASMAHRGPPARPAVGALQTSALSSSGSPSGVAAGATPSVMATRATENPSSQTPAARQATADRSVASVLAALPEATRLSVYDALVRLISEPTNGPAPFIRLAARENSSPSASPSTAGQGGMAGRWLHTIAVASDGGVHSDSAWYGDSAGGSKAAFFFNLPRRLVGQITLGAGRSAETASRPGKRARHLRQGTSGTGMGLVGLGGSTMTSGESPAYATPFGSPTVASLGRPSSTSADKTAREAGRPLHTVADRGRSSDGSPNGDPDGNAAWIVEEDDSAEEVTA